MPFKGALENELCELHITHLMWVEALSVGVERKECEIFNTIINCNDMNCMEEPLLATTHKQRGGRFLLVSGFTNAPPPPQWVFVYLN